MRMGVLTTSGIAIGAVLGLLGSPLARADDADFVRDVKAMGFLQASDNLISQAESACYFLVRKRSPEEVQARIARYTRVDPPSQAHLFLVLAVKTYCPQFTDLVGP
jgi:uncharacterized membrane protein